MGLCTGGFPQRSLACPGARVQVKGRELEREGGMASAASAASAASLLQLLHLLSPPLLLQLLQDAEIAGGWLASKGCSGAFGDFRKADLFPKRQCYSIYDRSSQMME